jgi:diaminohydroxyphosphoribosylaminopyrimidine deaminase/5-amino-6-(5-phosphoribosylamino)uracil reductase
VGGIRVASPLAERAAMSDALELARAGLGSTGGNPCVGAAVLDREGVLAGRGRTEPHTPLVAGRHAEIVALAEAGDRATGGTIVSTLEPCNGTGRTGPCSDAIVRAGVRRVVYALTDPMPAYAGGADRLAAAGIEVEGGLLADQAQAVHGPWLTAVWRGRPYVTLKLATSLDGRAAAADGTSQWITSAESRSDAHALRARVGAIVAGSGTVLADDPQLTVRGAREPRTPLRVVLDARGRTAASARVFDDSAPTYVHRDHDLSLLAQTLYTDYDIRHLLVEGGPTVAGAFLAAGLVDEVVAYLAPALLGAGANALSTSAFPTIDAARRLRITDVTRLGADVRITAVPCDEES